MGEKNINKNSDDKVLNPKENDLNENTEKKDEKKVVTPEEKIKELRFRIYKHLT